MNTEKDEEGGILNFCIRLDTSRVHPGFYFFFEVFRLSFVFDIYSMVHHVDDSVLDDSVLCVKCCDC